MTHLHKEDPTVYELIEKETQRLQNTLDLIAAESVPPPSILEAQGSSFAIKAAEGYPHRRFHAGCVFTDALEALAIERAKQLFGAEHANVQPHSGVSANLAVYFALLKPGDKILAMKLSHGGHLSHGDPASITSRCFQFKHYGVHPETERIDYDALHALALEYRPAMIVAGASSYPRLIDYGRIAKIAEEIGAYFLVDMAHIAGLVAGGAIPSPIPHSDVVTFTTYKTLLGGRGGVILCRKTFAKKIDQNIFPGTQGTPAVNMIAAKAVCFGRALKPEFSAIQTRILENADVMAKRLSTHGYRLVTGGTDNHLVLFDVTQKGLTGDEAEKLLESVGIVVNRNVIPREGEDPLHPSGIRLGTTAMASRGMGREEAKNVADLIDTTLTHRNDAEALQEVAHAVSQLCHRFPLKGIPLHSGANS